MSNTKTYFKQQNNQNENKNRKKGNRVYFLGILNTRKNVNGLSLYMIDESDLDEFIKDLNFVKMSESLPIFKDK